MRGSAGGAAPGMAGNRVMLPLMLSHPALPVTSSCACCTPNAIGPAVTAVSVWLGWLAASETVLEAVPQSLLLLGLPSVAPLLLRGALCCGPPPQPPSRRGGARRPGCCCCCCCCCCSAAAHAGPSSPPSLVLRRLPPASPFGRLEPLVRLLERCRSSAALQLRRCSSNSDTAWKRAHCCTGERGRRREGDQSILNTQPRATGAIRGTRQAVGLIRAMACHACLCTAIEATFPTIAGPAQPEG